MPRLGWITFEIELLLSAWDDEDAQSSFKWSQMKSAKENKPSPDYGKATTIHKQ